MANQYKNSVITTSRINAFLGWENFNPKGNVAPGRMDQNLCGRLWTKHNREAITITAAVTPSHRASDSSGLLTNISKWAFDTLSYKPVSVGDQFGPTFSTHLFRLEICIPDDFYSHQVHLIWDSNSEAMVLTEDGTPVQGLVGGDHWARRADCPLFPNPKGGLSINQGKMVVYIEISCNGLFGAGRGGDIEPPEMHRKYTLDECCLAVFDPTAWSLIHDVTLLQGLAKHLPDTPRKTQALYSANDVINAVDVSDQSTYDAGRKLARKYLTKLNGSAQSRVVAMLHSHIDLAWLWPMAATPAKGARTFATVLRLMEMYPQCLFVQSQAQLYEWVKTEYPTLWKQIRARVREGRFIPVGGTWVEMDCNIPSGEALVRQFLYGQSFFQDNFGIRCKEFWLPDTFGYSAQLPQIMKGCGIDFFMTQKLSWNLFNKFPHSSFIWEGLDGSRVLAHMPPSDTYNSQAFPEEVLRSAHKNKDAGVFDKSILLVGHGDGGGGPSPAMLESLNRMQNVDGVPRVEFGTPTEFFNALAERKDELPRWVGELYFELHRGTYTSQAKVKKNNRESEFALCAVEMYASLALLYDSEFEYPQDDLHTCWKLVLKNAFHDTLPGSSIRMVYDETDRDYAKVRKLCARMMDNSIGALYTALNGTVTGTKKFKTENGSVLSGEDESLTDEILIIKSTAPILSSTKSCVKVLDIATVDPALHQWGLAVQAVFADRYDRDEGLHRFLIAACEVQNQFGTSTVRLGKCFVEPNDDYRVSFRKKNRIKGGGFDYEMKNHLVRVSIAGTGMVTSLKLLGVNYDANVFGDAGDGKKGVGNRFVLYDDVPMFWCAWDSEVYSYEKKNEMPEVVESRIVEEGPWRGMIYFRYGATGDGSWIEQYVSLRSGSARLDFDTIVNWKERRKILRVLFDTQLRSSVASYDSQFGYVQRPTTFNHSWDIAKFEVVGHRFCDLSEHGFGVALMSDSKYGYSVRDGTMRLSLLRASKSPDDEADMGVHRFTYSLAPHRGSFPNSTVIAEAADLNQPDISEVLEVCGSRVGRFSGSLTAFQLVQPLSVENDAAILDCIGIGCFKKCERGDGFILRLFEPMGARGWAHIRHPSCLVISAHCNMLEDVDEESPNANERFGEETQNGDNDEGKIANLYFTPFQVRNILFSLK